MKKSCLIAVVATLAAVAGALAAVPSGNSLFALLGAGGALKAIVYGALWGVGGLTFGLSMRYLGVALGQSVSLGTCSAFGTLLPALFAGGDLLHGDGLLLLLGVCVTLAGIAVIGYAGSLRARNMSEEQKRSLVPQLRELSRQEYLQKREKMKLELLQKEVEEEEMVYSDSELTGREKRSREEKKVGGKR